LLPLAPETFSLTLSEVLGAQIPVVARSTGALADRLRGRAYAVLVDDVEGAIREVARLARDPEALHAMRRATCDVEQTSMEAWAARYARLDDGCRSRAPRSSRLALTADECRALNERRVLASDAPASSAVTRPSEHLAGRWWYPHAERLKPYVPESLRAPLRRRLASDGLRSVRRLRFSGEGVELGRDLRLVKRYFGTALYEAAGSDAFVVAEIAPIRASDVNAIRFNLWCSVPGYVYAQIYWRHAGDAGFSERKSVTVPLRGQAAAWMEYVVFLDRGPHASAWSEGGDIVALRFNPISGAQPVGLGDMVLCRDGALP
jgi:hypothetical protein